MPPARFTVLGAAGFIGRHLTAHLHAHGHPVATPGRQHALDGPDLGPDPGHVVYCIGRTADFRHRPFDTVEAHVCRLAALLRAGRFQSLLYLSSTRVYGRAGSGREDQPIATDPADPDALYDISKLAGESLCLSQPHPEIRVARLSNIFGPGMRPDTFLAAIAREAAAGAVTLATAPASRKDYLAVDDAVDALRRIALRGSQRLYNVAAGRSVDSERLLDALRRLTGCTVSIAAAAPLRRFPPIDTGRLQALYETDGARWAPRPVEDALPALLAALPAPPRADSPGAATASPLPVSETGS